MKPEALVDTWFRFFSPTVRLPASGDIGGFSFHPYTKWEAPAVYRGDDAVEQRVYREIASPGRQLGKLTDGTLELADQVRDLQTRLAALEALQEPALALAKPKGLPAGSSTGEVLPGEPTKIDGLRQLAKKIDDIKSQNTDNAVSIAKENLDRLLAKDEQRLRDLLAEYAQKLGRT